MNGKALGLVAALVFSIAPQAGAFPVSNLASYAQALNLAPLYAQRDQATKLKIAVLDNSFAGYTDALGNALPADTQYHAGRVAHPATADRHGLVMAEILVGLLTDQGRAPEFEPELHLYDSYGYTNFSDAVADAISRKVDLILYSQVWEYGGNDDGKGFINSVVNQATSAGILWVNASGDFGQTTFSSEIRDAADDWVSLPGQNQGLPIRCEGQNGCDLRLVLSWNDFKDDVNVGTDKDLDLFLTDDTLNILESSQLVQTRTASDRPGTSLYPREIIEAHLKPGLYLARIKDRSHNFSPAQDRLRITASGDSITLPIHQSDNTVFNPADNSSVITVGARDTDRTSFSTTLHKPEVATLSLIQLDTGESFKGTSSSAAAVAGALALYKSLDPALTRETALERLRQVAGPIQAGLPLQALGFLPTGQDGLGPCFIPLNPAFAPYYVQNAVARGGTPVQTSAGQKIFFPFDPNLLMPEIHRIYFNDILVIGPAGDGIYNRSMLYQLPPGVFEVLENPAGQRVCGY